MKSIRITPACAGITYLMSLSTSTYQDHPRVCGNYPSRSSLMMTRAGSPPRVRELHFEYFSDNFEVRITPACAGITQFRAFCLKCGQDHPRVCGNY